MRSQCLECGRLLGDGLDCLVCDDFTEFMRDLQDVQGQYPEGWHGGKAER